MDKNRTAIRLALENIREPVTESNKTYRSPFSVFREQLNPIAHEALHVEGYCLGEFGQDDEIVISQRDD